MSSSSHKLIVSRPCQEAWTSMTDADNGRHCKSCDRIVTDFSMLSDDEVRSFFLKNISTPVCGRFHKNQIDRIKIYIPSYVFNKPISHWKKFLIIFLVCFGSNLYPFDTFISSKPGLYAQSSSNKIARKKMNYKQTENKIRLNKEVTVKFVPQEVALEFPPQFETMIMGFTQIVPAPAVVPLLTILNSKVDSSPTNSDTLSSERELKRANGREKKPSKKPNSENTKEYILPARLEYQRKKPQPK